MSTYERERKQTQLRGLLCVLHGNGLRIVFMYVRGKERREGEWESVCDRNSTKEREKESASVVEEENAACVSV